MQFSQYKYFDSQDDSYNYISKKEVVWRSIYDDDYDFSSLFEYLISKNPYEHVYHDDINLIAFDRYYFRYIDDCLTTINLDKINTLQTSKGYFK